MGTMTLTGETEVLGDKPVLVPLCPPQIPKGMVWNRTRAFAGTGRQLTLFIVKRWVYKELEGVRKWYILGTSFRSFGMHERLYIHDCSAVHTEILPCSN
jgi:hypothetical protein